MRKNSMSLFDKKLLLQHFPPVKGKCPGAHSVHGHTHHPRTWTTHNVHGKYNHMVMGSMSDTDLEYIHGPDTSVNGFGWVYIDAATGDVDMKNIVVPGNMVMFNGRAYKRRLV
jgi:hypothetical protein